VGALGLDRRYLAATQSPSLEDALEAKLRFAIELLRRRLYLRLGGYLVDLFRSIHVDLIAALLEKLALQYLHSGFRSTPAILQC
jgi:hypothetical protein